MDILTPQDIEYFIFGLTEVEILIYELKYVLEYEKDHLEKI